MAMLALMCGRSSAASFIVAGQNSSKKVAQQSPRLSFWGGRHQQCSSTAVSSSASSSDVLEPLVVCGPSGVGKGTIIAKFMEELDGASNFAFSVSHTTRDPRPGETNGVHYHFTGLESMKQAIADGEFLEHAEVHGNFYGTSWQTLRDAQAQSKRCLLDIDVQGVKALKQQQTQNFQPKFIFIAPPSLDVLLDRLKGRGTETPESFQLRTANAKAELDYGLSEGNFDAIVVNNDLDVACQDFQSAVESLYGSVEESVR